MRLGAGTEAKIFEEVLSLGCELEEGLVKVEISQEVRKSIIAGGPRSWIGADRGAAPITPRIPIHFF